MEEKRKERFALRLGFDIAKVVLKAAGVAAVFCLVHEAHKIHKGIEAYKKA